MQFKAYVKDQPVDSACEDKVGEEVDVIEKDAESKEKWLCNIRNTGVGVIEESRIFSHLTEHYRAVNWPST